jgi:plasmid replication initiation protein
MEKEMCLDVENQVVMSNDLIKGKSNLSLNELKLLRLTIMQVIADDKDLMTYQIKIQDLAKILDITSQSIYRDVMEMCKHLLQEIVYIGDGNPKHKWKMYQWCSTCEYDEGTITIKLHEKLKPHLIQLKQHYTQYMLQDILMLKTVYAVRLYELIREEMKSQKAYADKIVTVSLDVETIRKATDTENKYKKIGMFNQRVIVAAITEINDKSCYYVTYEYIKKSRKITGFKFKIESKNNIYRD